MSRRYLKNNPGHSHTNPTSTYGDQREQPLRTISNGTSGNKKLDDSSMIIDAADDNTSAAEDVHVRELRRMFDSCDDDGDGALTTSGLERLCEELRLDDHREYIVNQLLPPNLPSAARKISFDSFKLKFIQLLPELVDFSSVTEKSKPKSAASPPTSVRNHLRVPGNNESGSNSNHSRAATSNRHQKNAHRSNRGQHQQQGNTSPRPVAAPRRRLYVLAGGMAATGDGTTMASDQDTSNDILSDFSDDERRRKQQNAVAIQKRKNRSSLGSDSAASSNASSGQQSPSRPSENRDLEAAHGEEAAAAAATAATITASDVEQILNGLGLADRGYLGRYEFRILCQHLGLNGLTASELNGLFNQLDKDADGRIAVDDFLLVCPATHSSSPAPTTSGGQQQGRNSCQDSSPRLRQQHGSSSARHEEGSEKAAPCSDGRVEAAVSTASVVDKNAAAVGDSTTNESSTNYAPLQITLGRNVQEKMKNLRTRTITLLGCLDESRTGHAKREDVLNYWDTLGIENGCEVLKKLGFPERQRWVDLKELSVALDQELCENVEHESSLLTAVLTLKAEVCFLKELFDESREQASHYLRELQQLNQRNAILVEEMDQQQQNLETRSQLQIKELEEKNQARISVLESKYREEREQWHTESKEKEEFLHKLEQTETTLQNRLRQLERENGKLKTELDDLSQMMKDVEDLNRDLRQALKDATMVKKQRQSSAENVLTVAGQAWTASSRTGLQSVNGDEALRKVMAFENGSRTGLVIHRSTTNGKSSVVETNPGCWRCASTSSTPAKKRVKYTPPSTSALLKRRRLQLHQHQNRRYSGGQARPLDSSDFESEPEPIIFKPKFKRPLKKRQRLALIANRDTAMHTELDGNALFSAAPAADRSSSTSTDEENHQLAASGSVASFSQQGAVSFNNGFGAKSLAGYYYRPTGAANANSANRENQFQHLAAFERRLSDERKFYAQELKVEIAAMEEEHARETRRLFERLEREKEQLKNECKRELEALIHSATSEKRAALEAQEAELRKLYESQRRDAEIKWATERNVMERRFAEDKMEMMERLQNDFEAELHRLRTAVANRSHDNSTSPSTSMENRMRFEQALQENAQLNAQLENLRGDLRKLNEQMAEERDRNTNLGSRNGELQRELAYWESKYNEANRENLALHDETKRVERDLREVSTELTILQQRAEEFERRRLEELAAPSRVNSSDVDVQTDRSSMVPVKDESVQLESPAFELSGKSIDPVSATVAYERIHESLSKGVKELEMLLQSGESGFEEEETGGDGTEVEVNDPLVLKAIYGKLRKRLSKAQAKFEEIRTDLFGEAACLNEIRLSGNSFVQTEKSRSNSDPAVTIANQETQTDDEDDRYDGRIVYQIEEEDEDDLDEIEMDGLFLDGENDGEKRIVCSPNASPAVVSQVTERLRDVNFLLRARLLEQKRLTGELTDRLQQQMRDTVKVSEVAQKLFARCKSLENEQSKKQHIL